jgi:hypothetical protein
MSAQARDEVIIDGESYYMSTFPMVEWLNELNIKIPPVQRHTK